MAAFLGGEFFQQGCFGYDITVSAKTENFCSKQKVKTEYGFTRLWDRDRNGNSGSQEIAEDIWCKNTELCMIQNYEIIWSKNTEICLKYF